MTKQEFLKQLDDWTEDVRRESEQLYLSGVSPERCLKLAIDVATARMLSKAEADARARRVVMPVVGSRN